MKNENSHNIKTNWFIRLFLLLAVLVIASKLDAQSLRMVPQPKSYFPVEERFLMTEKLTIAAPDDEAWKKHLEVVSNHLWRITNEKHQFAFSTDKNTHVRVIKDTSFKTEQYELAISDTQIQLTASSLKGLAHATATLLQVVGAKNVGALPGLKITDAPTLSYRNFMVDMGRNPHSLELLKETIDLLWYYKIDSLQLHLTDDQRIAFPSTAFPKLWDGKITLEQFKELEAYAVVRGVTLIPELEVPGHSSLLRGEYPEVFGKTPTDLASSEKALEGIKTILDEMLEVFSSTPYVHIGGDEAYGVSEELQRDLINTLHAHLKSKGKETIVWEGPRPGKGENKVNKEVIHLNWRTINYPADAMLQDGYRVVNAAWDPLYIVDHYPRINFTMTTPEHIYKTLKLTRFKHVNPGISTFANPIEVAPSERLIGFCMPWWEGREENYFPQNVPRLIPFSEVAWNPSIKRNFKSFAVRSDKTEATRIEGFYPIKIESDDLAIPSDGVFHNQVEVRLINAWGDNQKDEGGQVEIRYTLDGSPPNVSSEVYSTPLKLTKSTQVRAALFEVEKQLGHGTRRNFSAVVPVKNLALGKPVGSSVTSGPPFSVERVTDGGTKNLDFFLGYPAAPNPIAVTIDLEQVQKVGRVIVHAYTINNSFEKYIVEVSKDGKEFEEVAKRLEKPKEATAYVSHEFDSRDVRFVRILSQGNKGYVFDSFSKLVEIQVFEK